MAAMEVPLDQQQEIEEDEVTYQGMRFESPSVSPSVEEACRRFPLPAPALSWRQCTGASMHAL